MQLESLRTKVIGGRRDRSRRQESGDDRALGTSPVGVMARPDTGDERRAELRSSHETDHESAQAEPLVNVERNGSPVTWMEKVTDEDYKR
jgi:hypothetical protein